jgi:hypothetical protein
MGLSMERLKPKSSFLPNGLKEGTLITKKRNKFLTAVAKFCGSKSSICKPSLGK